MSKEYTIKPQKQVLRNNIEENSSSEGHYDKNGIKRNCMQNIAPGIRVTLQSSCSGPKLRDTVEEEEINKCMNTMVLCGHYLNSRYCSVLD